MEMNNVVKIIAILLLVVIASFAFKSLVTGSAMIPTGNVVAVDSTVENTGEVQTVEVSFKNYGYYPNPIVLKKDVPAILVFDLDTVYGCMRAVRIPSFGIEKYVQQGDNVIEFTPTKAGEFSIMCSMGMGTGKIIVEEADGSVPETTDEPLAIPEPTGSCGSSAGGCGCGSS